MKCADNMGKIDISSLTRAKHQKKNPDAPRVFSLSEGLCW